MDSGFGASLRVKYKMPDAPTEQQVRRWAQRVEALIANGVDAEEAGGTAASEIFDGVGTMMLKSQADTIQALLARARER